MSYAYLRSRPRAIDSTNTDNLLELRADLRTPAGAVMAAPLAIAMLDAATINLESMKVLAVTQVGVDIYNATNTDVATGFNQAFSPSSPTWLTPTTIQPARYVKVNAQVDF